LARRVAALPLRARLALVAAVVLSVVVVLLLVVPGDGGEGGEDTAGDPGTAGTEATGDGGHGATSTTLNTGGIEVAAPEGWQPIPVPDLGFGIAVPPGWEAALLSPEGLATLARSSPVVPDFVDDAHAAAATGGLVYAAGEEAGGAISDVVVRAAPQTGVTDAAGLAAYAETLATEAGRADPQAEVVEGAALPTARLRFQVGAGGEVAEGTETFVLGPDGIVWSVTVTSDDAATHVDLAAAIAGTLTFASG
jgi:hypothetical protein